MDCITDALSFFGQSCGRWRSQRSQHHLLHRRAEAGASLVEVAMVEADDPTEADQIQETILEGFYGAKNPS